MEVLLVWTQECRDTITVRPKVREITDSISNLPLNYGNRPSRTCTVIHFTELNPSL
jgi:hypothetical protein